MRWLVGASILLLLAALGSWRLRGAPTLEAPSAAGGAAEARAGDPRQVTGEPRPVAPLPGPEAPVLAPGRSPEAVPTPPLVPTDAPARSGPAEIAGVVVDGAGVPIEGARVDWVEEGKQPRRAPEATGPDGRFRAEFPRRSAKGAVVATHPGRLGEARAEWPLPGGATEARLVLAGGPAGALCVHVPSPPPKELPRGALILTPLLEGGPATHHSFDGALAHLERLEPGRWHVRFVPLFSPWLPLEHEVEVEAGRTAELDLLPEPGEALEGRVLEADRAPAPGLKVTARLTWTAPARTPRAGGASTGGRYGGSRTIGSSSSTSYSVGTEGASMSVTTDADGRFRIPGIPREGAVLEVDQEGRPFAAGTVRPGPPLEILLPGDPPALSVKLPPLPGRRPEWSIEVWGGGLKRPRSAHAKAEGRFRALAAAEYVVLAAGSHPDGPLAGLGRVALAAGGHAELEIRPERAATVTYAVVAEETGIALRSAEESVRVGAVVIRQDWWTSRADGKVEFPPNEDFVLRLSADGRDPVEIPLRLAPGETRALGEIRLRRIG
ncbi:MAG: carboxypeptidase-like regulatory domain-containing protein [Planctomycetales bacterium]|nr:carboxypeptidase-like regulatory domain-containing protein [Planctomycetales bacterium]